MDLRFDRFTIISLHLDRCQSMLNHIYNHFDLTASSSACILIVGINTKVRFWTECNDSKEILQECVGLENFTEVVKSEATLRFVKVSLNCTNKGEYLVQMCIV